MWAVITVSLWVVMLLALAGALAPKQWFDDNLLQRMGLSALSLGTLSGLDGSPVSEGGQMLMYAGLAVFGSGTALKVWWHRPKKKMPPPAPRYHRDNWAG